MRWNRQCEFSRGVVEIGFDLRDWMWGIAWGPRDVVIRPIPCVMISIDASCPAIGEDDPPTGNVHSFKRAA